MPEEKRISTNSAMQMLNFFRSVAEGADRKRIAARSAKQAQVKLQVQEHRKKREFALTNMAKYMDSLGEGPSKDLARTRFKDYFGSLPAFEQEVLAPHFQKLYSPIEEKMIEFEKMRGKPVDPATVDPTTDPTTRAKLEFANQDYIVDRENYGLGTNRKKDNTVFLGEGIWAWRDDQGKMGILSREGSAGQEWQQKALDKANMTWDTAMAQGGVIPSGPSKSVVDGRTRFELTPTVDINTGKVDHKKVAVGQVARTGERELPKIMSEFADSVTLGKALDKSRGGGLYDEFQSRLDELDMVEGTEIPYHKLDPKDQTKVIKRVMQDVLKTHMGNWNIEVKDIGKFEGGLWNNFAQTAGASIFFIPGVPQEFYNSQEQFVGMHYYDSEYDVVRDTQNRVLGTKAELDAAASGENAEAWMPKRKGR